MVTRLDYERALCALDDLVATETQSEAPYQNWFREHQGVAFKPHNYSRVLDQPHLPTTSGVYIPDFMGQRIDNGLWEIFEIKRPDTEVLKSSERRESFYASFQSYISQCRDYANFFREKEHRDYFNRTYVTDVQTEVPSIIVAGRSEGLDRKRVSDMMAEYARRIQFHTYDDIGHLVEQARVDAFGAGEELPGTSLHLVLIPKKVHGRANYLFDEGVSEDRERISLYIDDEDALCFVVRDSNVRTPALRIRVPIGGGTFDYDKPHWLACEAGFAHDSTTLSIDIDGQFSKALSVEALEWQPTIGRHFVMGSDIWGKEHSEMDVWAIEIYSKTLSFWHRRECRARLMDRFRGAFQTRSVGNPVEFRGNQMLHSANHPNFGLSAESRRPLLF